MATINVAMLTCKMVGLIVQEHWRQDYNNVRILQSPKTCLLKLTPIVLCLTKSSSNLYEDDANGLKTKPVLYI